MEVERVTEKAMLRFHQGSIEGVPAVAERSAYHDVAGDILTEFHPWMPLVYFPSDKGLLSATGRYAESAEYAIRFGAIVTGELFVENKDRGRILCKHGPLAVDMETAAAAHVCYVNGVPFLSVRTVTDTGGDSGPEAFERNCERTSEITAEVAKGLLRAWTRA